MAEAVARTGLDPLLPSEVPYFYMAWNQQDAGNILEILVRINTLTLTLTLPPHAKD